MSRGIRFFVAIALTLGSYQYGHSKTSNKAAKARIILDLQSKINGYHNSERMVTSYLKFTEKDAKTKVLRTPADIQQLQREIDESYITEMTQKLSEKEMDYLISLYSSSMYQKYISLERDFWNKRALQIMNEKISLYQKKAPKQ